MPFESAAQRRFMYARHPEMAKRWEKETPKGKLPEYKHKDHDHERKVKSAFSILKGKVKL